LKRYRLLACLLLLSLLPACRGPWPFLPALEPAPPATSVPLPATPTLSPTSPQPLVLGGHGGALSVLAWAPDGQMLAAASGWFGATDTRIRLWHRDGTPGPVLAGHTDSIPAQAWAPDGQTLASGSLDGTVRLWAADGTARRTITPGAGQVFAVAWAPDGQILATGSIRKTDDLTVHLWRPDGTPVMALHTRYSGGKFYNLGWAADGTRLAGGATDYSLWTAEGTVLTNTFGCAHCTPAWGLAWAPNSQVWATANESGLVSIYSRDGALLTLIQDRGSTNTLAWSPDSALLATGDTVNIWRADGTALTARVPIDRIASLAWAPDGQTLASGGEKGEVRLWNRNGQERAVLRGHTGPVNRVAWSPDGALLASASDDGTVRLWAVGWDANASR
jgi:WD40 repeat protein